MNWTKTVRGLRLSDEQQFISLLQRNPCDPLIYILKVEEITQVSALSYYRILIEKYKEEKNYKLLNLVISYEYILRNDRYEK
ncbi:hypothetical protein [Metabacillus idriensis]|uniref:hypothetical protein n=1 Tax=Metabacillus idriensis TaxID=324768 RepID=UPI0017480784|nr:hypothetical protein [Metabacillus idriensis]